MAQLCVTLSLRPDVSTIATSTKSGHPAVTSSLWAKRLFSAASKICAESFVWKQEVCLLPTSCLRGRPGWQHTPTLKPPPKLAWPYTRSFWKRYNQTYCLRSDRSTISKVLEKSSDWKVDPLTTALGWHTAERSGSAQNRFDLQTFRTCHSGQATNGLKCLNGS